MITSADAPPQVVKAVVLLWATLLFAIIESFMDFAVPDPEIAEIWDFLIGFAAIVTLLYGLLIYFASRRRNWARYILLLGTVVTVLFYALWPPEDGMSVIVAEIVSLALQIIAMFWLFTGEGSRWYRTRFAQ